MRYNKYCMKRHRPSDGRRTLDAARLHRLAWFRYQLRRFLRFSERAAQVSGITPQQHQLLLGVAGYTGRGWATISELAEFLQERHNAVVGLVERAERRGLVRKEPSPRDRRVVQVRLTRRGEAALKKLTQGHLRELWRARLQILEALKIPPKALRVARRAQGQSR